MVMFIKGIGRLICKMVVDVMCGVMGMSMWESGRMVLFLGKGL